MTYAAASYNGYASWCPFRVEHSAHLTHHTDAFHKKLMETLNMVLLTLLIRAVGYVQHDNAQNHQQDAADPYDPGKR